MRGTGSLVHTVLPCGLRRAFPPVLSRARRAPVFTMGSSAAISNLAHWLPITILTDSYKATHFLQYPDATKMVAVSERRKSGL